MTHDEAYPHSYYTSLDNYPTKDRVAVAQAIALQFEMVPKEHIAGVQQAFLDDVADGKILSGIPAFENRDWLRSISAFRRLGEIARTIRELEKRFTKMEKDKSCYLW